LGGPPNICDNPPDRCIVSCRVPIRQIAIVEEEKACRSRILKFVVSIRIYVYEMHTKPKLSAGSLGVEIAVS